MYYREHWSSFHIGFVLFFLISVFAERGILITTIWLLFALCVIYNYYRPKKPGRKRLPPGSKGDFKICKR